VDGLFIGGIAGLGVGVVGVTLGTVFALSSKSKRDKANDICSLPPPGPSCPDGSESRINSLDDGADSAQTLATVGFIAGGVGLAAGGTLLWLSLSDSETGDSGGASFTPIVGWRSVGLAGRF
jgi:hypothetical protein